MGGWVSLLVARELSLPLPPRPGWVGRLLRISASWSSRRHLGRFRGMVGRGGLALDPGAPSESLDDFLEIRESAVSFAL